MEYHAKRSWAGLQWGTVEHNIGKREFSLPNNCIPVKKLQLKSLELENQEIKSTIFVLNVDLVQYNKMLEDNHPLVTIEDQFYKLKSINKRP